jgi:hypothetical protein
MYLDVRKDSSCLLVSNFLFVFTVCIIIAWLWFSLEPKPVAVNKHIHKDAAAKHFWYICLLGLLASVTGN